MDVARDLLEAVPVLEVDVRSVVADEVEELVLVPQFRGIEKVGGEREVGARIDGLEGVLGVAAPDDSESDAPRFEHDFDNAESNRNEEKENEAGTPRDVELVHH